MSEYIKYYKIGDINTYYIDIYILVSIDKHIYR